MIGSSLTFQSSTTSSLGNRLFQNDAILTGSNYLVLCDGAGDDQVGHDIAQTTAAAFGTLATSLVLARTGSSDFARALSQFPSDFALTHTQLGGKTTLAAAVLDSDLLWAMSLGDSILYVLREWHDERGWDVLLANRRRNRTLDTDLLGERPWARDCVELTRFVTGKDANTSSIEDGGPPDIQVVVCRTGDIVIILSDGFELKVTPAMSVMIASALDGDMSMIRQAIERTTGSVNDNASAIIARVI